MSFAFRIARTLICIYRYIYIQKHLITYSPSSPSKSPKIKKYLVTKFTSSEPTGFWEFLLSSSIVAGSFLKSFLQPTKRIGKPWQKWRTSEIHYKKEKHVLVQGQQEKKLRGKMIQNLFLNVLQRVGRINSKTNQNNMRIRVWQGSKTIIILLACVDMYIS